MTKPRKPLKTNAHGLRKPRQERALVNPISYAIAGAVKPHKAQIAEINHTMNLAAKAMREGVATSTEWGIIAGSLEMAIAIERGGIVRGLQEHFDAFAPKLQAIHDRAMATGQWQRTSLWYHELDELKNFIELHTIQLKQLSRSELETALKRAQSVIKSGGGVVEVVRNVPAFEAERMAA